MINPFRTTVVIALLSLPVFAAAERKVEFVGTPIIVVTSEGSTATGTVTLRNAGDDPKVIPSLIIGPFTTLDGKEPLSTTAKPAVVPEIGKDATATISVELTNIEPGRSKAEVYDGSTKLGELQVVKKVFAFNVTPVGYDGKQPFPVDLQYEEAGVLRMINSDSVLHSFTWSLRDGQKELAKGTVPSLRPQETYDVTIPPKSAGFLEGVEGTLQRPQSPATLVLRAGAADSIAKNDYWVAKDIPLLLRYTAGSGTGRDLRQFGWIFLLLLAGGVASLYLTYWVPNMLKKMKVKARIEELTPRIHELRRTPPTLRVLLSVQRNQLRARLGTRHVLNLDFPALAEECEARANALHCRLELVQQIEYLLSDIEREWESGTTVGPTILRRADASLDAAVARLAQEELTDDDLRAVQEQVAAAKADLRSTSEDEKLTKALLNRALLLQQQKADLQPVANVAVDLLPALTTSAQTAVDWPAGFWKLDYAVTKMEVAAGVPTPAQQQKLLNFLRLHSLVAFEEAYCEARQIREQIFPEKLREALETKKTRIVFHPEHPRVNALVSFELGLINPTLNSAAAKHTFSCRWDFGDNLHEDGWCVSHYFARPGIFTVKPIVTDRDGAPIEVDAISVEVKKETNELFGAFTRIELARLGVALFVVLLGLLGGAKDQLAKLDFVPALIAVFLLGVTADQIKNLLVPKSQ